MSSFFSPIINKFEILPYKTEIHITCFPFVIKNSKHFENIATSNFMSEKSVNVNLEKYQFKIEYHNLDLNLDFQTYNNPLESNILQSYSEADQEKVELKKFSFTSIDFIMDHFSIFDVEPNGFNFMQLPDIYRYRSENINDEESISVFRYPMQSDFGQSLAKLNDSDIISEMLYLPFLDYKLLKVSDMMFPKRWMPDNASYFIPASLSKWKKLLDLDVNWNYVNAFKEIYACSGYNLMIEWQGQNVSSSSEFIRLEEEIQITTEETKDIFCHDQQDILLEKRSSIDTKFLVDRFMVKRGRSYSNLEQENDIKKAKIQEKKMPVTKDFLLQDTVVEDDLPCPKFDTENAIKFKYIAKSQFFYKRELVHILESKYVIELVERDLEDDASINDREDVIVDENTCIILHTLTDLLCPVVDSILDSVKDTKLGQKILSLSLRYSNIFVLLSDGDLEKPDSRVLLSKIKIDPLTPPIMKSLLAFYQFAYVLESLITVKVQIFIASPYDHIAWWIRSIGEKAASNSSIHSWNSRSFIKDIESPAERFLSMFPVINSFQAQIMLSQMSIREIINLSKYDLVDKFHVWIPERSLLIFYSMTHMKLEIGRNI